MVKKKNGCLQEKQPNSLVLPLKHYVTGVNKIKLLLLEMHPDKECIVKKTSMTFLVALLMLKRKGKSVTVGSPLKNKWMTLKDKKIFLGENTLATTWYQTLGLVSTGKEKALKPFWNKQCQEKSQKWWLPTKTDYVGSDLNCLKTSLPTIMSNSLFTIEQKTNPHKKNLQTTLFPSFMFSPVKNMEKEDINEEMIRAKKIRLYPNVEQKEILRKWMGTTRYVYNKTLSHVKSEDLPINFFSLRNKFVIAKDNPEVEEWETFTPKDVRAGAVKDMVTAYKAAFTNLRKGNITKFRLAFRSRKRGTQAITIPKSAIKIKDDELFIYGTKIKDSIKIGGKKKEMRWLDEVACDCKLSLKNGCWYLFVPVKMNRKKNVKGEKTIAFDPGVRTFMTGYSQDEVIKFQHNRRRLDTLRKKLDILRSLREKKILKKGRFNRKWEKQSRKMGWLVDEFQFKTISFLKNRYYDNILLPSFETQDMAGKSNNRFLNREMMQLKHYQFQCRMKDAFGDKVVICTEEYTSKTCGKCGSLHPNLGSNDVFKCSSCDLIIDRDINGARNILLKHLYT